MTTSSFVTNDRSAGELGELSAQVTNEKDRVEFIDGFHWPAGVRIAVNFTADYDAMLFRKVLGEPILQLSKGEFGGRVGIWRLVELFNKHDVKATFFTPGRIAELFPESLRAAVAGGHELGDHMWEHRTPKEHEWQIDHIAKTKSALTSFMERQPVGTRSFYPHGPLKDAGFLYNSVRSASDMPYYMGDEKGEKCLVELPYHAALTDTQFFNFGWMGSEPSAQRLTDPDRVLEFWWDAFLEQYERCGYLNLCLHPYVSGRAMRISMLDELIKRMKKYTGVWFPTCETVARYCFEKFPPDTLRP